MVCVGVQASVYNPPIKLVWIVFPVVYNHLFRHVLIVDPCLRKHISLQPCVSNTSGLCPVSVFKHLSSVPVIKHVWFGAPCCVQVFVSIRASTHFVVLVCAHHQSTALCLKHVTTWQRIQRECDGNMQGCWKPSHLFLMFNVTGSSCFIAHPLEPTICCVWSVLSGCSHLRVPMTRTCGSVCALS